MDFLIYMIISAVLLVYTFFHEFYNYWKSHEVAFIKGMFPFGNIRQLGNKVHLKDIVQPVYEMASKKDNPYGGLHIFFSAAAVPVDLDFIKTILIKDFDYFNDRGFYCDKKNDSILQNLLMLNGEEWNRMHQTFAQLFEDDKMKFFFPTILKMGDRFKDAFIELHNEKSKSMISVDICDISRRYITDILSTTILGNVCNSLKNPKTIFNVYAKKIFTERIKRPKLTLFEMTTPSLAKYLKGPFVSEFHELFVRKCVQQAIHDHKRNVSHENDLIDILLNLNESHKIGEFSTEEIIVQAFAFFFAGYETISTTMSYCLNELAENPDIQRKLRLDIMETLKKEENQLTYETIMKMIYLDQVINETLRKYPPNGFLFRKAVKDYKVEDFNKKTITKGTLLLIPVHSIHRDERYYPDPEKFNPDRFSREEVRKRHPCAFMPFGIGSRSCIGWKFAKLVMFTGLINLLMNYQFTLQPGKSTPDVDITNILTTTPKDGLFLNIEKI